MVSVKIDSSKLKGKIIEKYASQAAFAEDIGVSPQHMSKIIRGETDFKLTTLQAMVEKLDLTSDELSLIFFNLNVSQS